MRFWRRELAQIDVPAPRGEVEPDTSPTEGELARKRAEEQLTREVERTEAIRADTPRIVGLGERLGRIYRTNHIREDVLKAVLHSRSGGA